ncbi:hypothetical protein GRJ2_002134300 [Grus japonensis]|uniref:Uncharacterized protein n=1 Tax=Grus japonensis TaxID=30415 RepID=A0ABC9XGA1_GRUJA
MGALKQGTFSFPSVTCLKSETKMKLKYNTFLYKPLDIKYWTRLRCSQSCKELCVSSVQKTSRTAAIFKQHS